MKKNMAKEKFYRLKKDTPALNAGAILKKGDCDSDYQPISDIWDTDACESNNRSYFTAYVVEHAADWYERVYPVNLLTKTVYKLKAEAMEAMNKEYDGK